MNASALQQVVGFTLVILLGAPGCVERRLSITSEPSGALVYLNDQEVGRTPVEVPFRFYGTYDVRLEREGYDPLWTEAKAKAPVWEYPPFDLVAEAVPGAKSTVRWHFELEASTPVEERDTDALVDRAGGLRDQLIGP